MSAPDTQYVTVGISGQKFISSDKDVAFAVGHLSDSVVETYHHDRVVQDLRRRLDALVEFLRSPNYEDEHISKWTTESVKSAIEAAKGGK